MRRCQRRGLLGICALLHHEATTTTAFAPCCPAAGTRSRAASRPHAALAESPPSTPRHRRSGAVCVGDRARDSRAMLNSVVLLPSPTALAGSGALANAIFRSSSSSGGASLPTQGSPGMQHGLVEALQPLLSYLVVLLRSIAPSPLEVQLVSRLFVAASVGMFIGTERRTSHRPAGVRTMSLVALGACTFTLVSQFGFVGRADQARVAASVASGVGFIGAGVITTSGKEASIRDSFARGRGASHYPSDTTSTYNDVDGEVRGLTTASAIWITAGLGMACGTGLFFVATLGAVLTVGILKISEVITSLGKKWIMVRSILRPKLAQRLAEEEEERVRKEKSARVVSALDEQDHEEIKEDKELKEKETREKEEKEKKKKEKEKKLRMEQEQQAKAEKTIAARVVDEESGGASLSESGWADDDDEGEEEEEDEFDDEVNDLKDLHKRRSENVEYAHDPFYGDPWKSEVPKLRRLIADDGSVLESPPLFGPTRRRYLKRSRILASRKRRLDRTRLLRYGVPIGSSSSASPSASALPQKPEQQQQQQQQTQASVAPASDFPTTVGGGRAAVESALDRHVTAVGDTLLSEKRMEQEQQALQQRQQQQKQHHQQQQQQQQQQQPQRPPNKPRKPKTLTNQQDNGVAEAYVPFASDTEDAETTTLEPTEALPKKPTKSRGRSQSGGGDGGSGATPKDANIQETTPLEATIKGSSGLPNAGAVMKASTGAPGARVDGKRKTEEMTSSRGETPELGGVFEGAAAAATEVQATAEARARLADGWANGLDGSPDSSV